MLRKWFIVVLFVLVQNFIFAQNAAETQNPQRAKLAVSDFQAIDVDQNTAIKVRETIINYIVRANKYQVVERSQLESVMRELRLSQSDLYDPGSVAKLGRLIAARGIVVGSVSRQGDELVIQARLVDIQNGQIIRSSRVSTPYSENISGACAKTAYQLINLPFDENVLDSEVYLDFPFWRQKMIGLNFGVGLARRLGKFNGYTDEDASLIEVKFVQQASVKFMMFFSRSSSLGLMFDIGWYTFRIHENGYGQNGVNMYTYLSYITLHYLYYSLSLVARFRDMFAYGGVFGGTIMHASGKMNTYQEVGTPTHGFTIEDKKIFERMSFGAIVGLGYTFKNLPGDVKLVMSVEFKMTLTGVVNIDEVRAMSPSAGKYDSASGIKFFALFVNFGILFGLR